jgi:hypothetical protein
VGDMPETGQSIQGRSRRRLLLRAVFTSVALVVMLLLLASPALAPAPSFPDVPGTHPYYGAIMDLANRSIVQGYTNRDFGPGDPVTRQQFAKMIVLTGGYPVSAADVCPFSDVDLSVPPDLYPDHYVAVAAAHGITVGTAPGLFSPGAYISRYEVVSMVVRAADDLDPGLLVAPPAGWTGNPTWGADPTHGPNARRAEYNGLLAGLPLDTLDPWGDMPRGEVAQVLHNLLVKLTPASTTTTSTSTTTTSSSTTTTTVPATTTTSSAPTTTSATTTTTTVTPPATTDYAIAGLENTEVVVKVRDQFGNPVRNVEVRLSSSALEGSGLDLLNSYSIGSTDDNGTVAYAWGRDSGDWGVEEVTAWVNNGTPQGLTSVVALIQWIYDDVSTDYIGAVSGQQKVTVAAGYAPWDGLTLKAYLNPRGAVLGSGTYSINVGLSFSTTLKTWSTGEGFFVGATSTDTDGKPNWMYNVVP